MVSQRSKPLRRHSSLLHHSFRRAPREGTAGLRNPASCEPVRERGDQVFGESNRSTADGDYFPNDNFFPDIGSLFIDNDDMSDTGNNTAATTAAATYASLSHLYEILLQFICLVFTVDWICFTTVLDICMLALIASVVIYLIIFRIKLYAKLLIYSTLRSSENPAVAFSRSEYLYKVIASAAARASLDTSAEEDEEEVFVVPAVCFPDASAS